VAELALALAAQRRPRPRDAVAVSPRDETTEQAQWEFRPVSDVLKTTPIRFVEMKRFPSLSFSFHAKTQCDTSFNVHGTPHETLLKLT
jgi:hypothetical protein